MRVLMVFDVLSDIGGGSQKSALHWVKNLISLGIDVKLLCNESHVIEKSGISRNHLIIMKSNHLNVFFPQYQIIFFLPPTAKKEVIDFKPDIIHFHEPSLVSLALIKLFQNSDVKFITSLHTAFKKMVVNKFPFSLVYRENGLMNKITVNLQSRLFKASGRITTPSVASQEFIQPEYRSRAQFLPYPVGKEFFLKKSKTVSDKPTKLVTLSRLSGEKHTDILIDMMQYLPECTLTISGEGVDKTFLQERVRKLGLEQRIKFLGWLGTGEILDLLAHSDLFLSASDFETFGITYIEALASQVPCLAYDYAVSREVIPGNMAFFVPDLIPRSWADAVKKIIEKPDLYRSMRLAIDKDYSKIFKYQEVESTKKLISMYNSLI